jgi:hypothetical protein
MHGLKKKDVSAASGHISLIGAVSMLRITRPAGAPFN